MANHSLIGDKQMINISDNLQFILNNLKESSDSLQNDIDEFKDDNGEQAKLIVSVIKERKQKIDRVYTRLEYHSKEHYNLVMLTDDELDKLCEGLE